MPRRRPEPELELTPIHQPQDTGSGADPGEAPRARPGSGPARAGSSRLEPRPQRLPIGARARRFWRKTSWIGTTSHRDADRRPLLARKLLKAWLDHDRNRRQQPWQPAGRGVNGRNVLPRNVKRPSTPPEALPGNARRRSTASFWFVSSGFRPRTGRKSLAGHLPEGVDGPDALPGNRSKGVNGQKALPVNRSEGVNGRNVLPRNVNGPSTPEMYCHAMSTGRRRALTEAPAEAGLQGRARSRLRRARRGRLGRNPAHPDDEGVSK